MILVTGARGFIGSALVRKLRDLGMDVLPMSRSDTFRLEDDKVELDLNEIGHLARLREEKILPSTVIHLAGHIEIALTKGAGGPSSRPVPGPENLSRIYQANLQATVNLAEFCRDAGVRHLLFASSQTVYGMPISEHITEETPSNPLEHYAMSKACCERILRLAATDSLAVTVFRFPGVYSEQRTSGAVYRFCESATKEKRIRVTSEIPLPFDVIHRDDVLSAFSLALRRDAKGFSLYNIATGEPCSLDLLADRVAGLVSGCTVEHAPVPQPVIRMDSAKAFRELGWRAEPSQVRLRQVLDAIRHD